MKTVWLATLLMVGCGSGAPTVDFAPPWSVDDLSAPVLDFAVQSAPPDLMPPNCTPPRAGIYAEALGYTYTPAGGGTAIQASSQNTVVVRNDGTISRPSTTFAAPNLFHCNFATVDPKTCLASCCPDQLSTPLVYVDSGGWTMWIGGACAFQTTTGAQYVANITYVEALFSR